MGRHTLLGTYIYSIELSAIQRDDNGVPFEFTIRYSTARPDSGDRYAVDLLFDRDLKVPIPRYRSTMNNYRIDLAKANNGMVDPNFFVLYHEEKKLGTFVANDATALIDSTLDYQVCTARCSEESFSHGNLGGAFNVKGFGRGNRAFQNAVFACFAKYFEKMRGDEVDCSYAER